MPIPSKLEQIEKIAEFLDSDRTEGRSLEDVAEDIVDGFHKMLKSDLKKPVTHPHVGMAFKHPTLSGVWHVAYTFDDRIVWLVNATTSYGFWMNVSSDFWKYTEGSTAKSGAPGSNEKWIVGDVVSRGHRTKAFRVIATGTKTVLLQDLSDIALPSAESNLNMEKYYRREGKGLEW